MDIFLALVFVLSLVGTLIGAVIWLFARPRGRRLFRVSALLSIASFIAFTFITGASLDEGARDAGFASWSDQQDAENAGFTDAEEWASEKERISAEEEAARIAQEEAERASAEAERRAEAEAEAARIAAEKADEAERLAEAEDERRKGFHCLSVWDGSHRQFFRDVRAMMRNPDSMEHIETRVSPVGDDGQHGIRMQYRAENGFGGMNVSYAIGTFSNEDCEATIIAVE